MAAMRKVIGAVELIAKAAKDASNCEGEKFLVNTMDK